MNLENVHQAIFDAWNARDFDGMRAMLHPDYTYTGPDGREQPGAEVAIAVAQMFASAFPDATVEVGRVYTSGYTVIAEVTGQGTHGGEFLGIAPTGKNVTIHICNVMEMRDGKIHREREYFDMAGILAQIGVNQIPAHGAAA